MHFRYYLPCPEVSDAPLRRWAVRTVRPDGTAEDRYRPRREDALRAQRHLAEQGVEAVLVEQFLDPDDLVYRDLEPALAGH